MMLKPVPKFTLGDLLENLKNNNSIDDTGCEKIVTFLDSNEIKPSIPWYFKILIAVGAWIAAIFFLSFLFISRIVDYSSTVGFIIWGVFFIGFALVMINLLRKNDFSVQLALALSAIGHFLALVGLAGDIGRSSLNFNWETVFLVSLVLCVVLYPLFRNSIHRFLSCCLVSFTSAAWVMELKAYDLFHVIIFIDVSIILFMLSKGGNNKKNWRPLFYALAVSVLFILFIRLVPHNEIGTAWWPSNVIMVVLPLIAMIRWESIFGITWRSQMKEPLILSVLGIILLGVVSTPGILASIGVIVLGARFRDNILKVVGAVFLPVYIYMFYYSMDITLDVKSLIMGGSGLVLLGLREYLRRRPWVTGKSA
jgi:hypothetical protein